MVSSATEPVVPARGGATLQRRLGGLRAASLLALAELGSRSALRARSCGLLRSSRLASNQRSIALRRHPVASRHALPGAQDCVSSVSARRSTVARRGRRAVGSLLIAILALLLWSSAANAAPTIATVLIASPASDPDGIYVGGTGFGSQPPSPSNLALPGYTGSDYGNALYLCDTTPNPNAFCAGQNNGGGGDLIGLVTNNCVPPNIAACWNDSRFFFDIGSSYSQYYYPNNIYRLQQGDRFTLTVEGATCSGTVAYDQTVSCSPPLNKSSPAISGTPRLGQSLTCSPGTWLTGPASHTYQWQRDGSDVAGATASTYTVQSADSGHSLTCAVTETNSVGSATATSAPLAIPTAGGGTGGGGGGGPPCGSVDDSYQMLVDQPHGGRRGRFVAAYGNVQTARWIGVLVPGIGNSYAKEVKDHSVSNAALAIKHEIDRLFPCVAAQTAVVAWVGYDEPPGPDEFGATQDRNSKLNITEAADTADAIAGAPLLTNFVTGLRQGNADPSGVRVTLIGHSYGTTVVARAVAQHALRTDEDALFVGSPGTDFTRASQLPAHIFAGENPDDMIQFANNPGVEAALNGLPAQLVLNALSFYLGAWHDIGKIHTHGPDPASTAFGAQAHRVSMAGECGHSYFADLTNKGSEGLANMARIIVGQESTVTPETRPTVPAFTPVPPRNLAVFWAPALRINWRADCGPGITVDLSELPAIVTQKVVGFVAGVAGTIAQKVGGALSGVAHVVGGVVVGGLHFVGGVVVNVGSAAVNKAGSVLQAGGQAAVDVYGGIVSIAQHLPFSADASRASPQPVLIARTAITRFGRSGRFVFRLRLTAAGRHLLLTYAKDRRKAAAHRRREPGLNLTVAVLVRPAGHRTIVVGVTGRTVYPRVH
jgi:pimeloyl-ACP methyl ester carboxylesterase